MDKKIEQQCDKCKFFLRHYVRNVTAYLPVSCGHCINPDQIKKYNNKFELNDNCEYWQPAEGKKAERRVKIEQVLQNIAESLDRIKNILIDDKD